MASSVSTTSMMIGRSIDSRRTLSVWSLLEAPNPAMPRSTVAERTHGRERAAEPDGQGGANVGRNQRRAGGDTDDEAEQERTRDVHGEGSERKTARGAALDPSLEAVARECVGDAAERDIQDSQKKTPAMNGSGRSHQPGKRRLKANSIACLETNYDGRRR